MSEEFEQRLEAALKGGSKIRELIDDEADLKARLVEEAEAQERRLRDLGEQFRRLKKGGG